MSTAFNVTAAGRPACIPMGVAMCLLSSWLLLSACHDDVISAPAEVAPDATTFTADPLVDSAAGVRITHAVVVERDRLELVIETWPARRLQSVDLLLRIDPGARAQVSFAPGSWCASGVSWSTLAEDQGIWPFSHPFNEVVDCQCPDPEGTGNFTIARLEVRIREPGTWRIDVIPGTSLPLCDCEGCPPDLDFSGGIIHVPAP